tara:strand:+ start:350 stop:961 length:612 start_codon:yes stop_codon:yes gene_type:complete
MKKSLLLITFFSKKRNQNFIANKPSSEEQFIQNYLYLNNIEYISEFKVHNLKDDKKKSRRVDFYLPKLGIYLEYFGWYNKSKKAREDYDEKAKVYIKNNMPTVIIYPHELGFLDYALHNKILKVLRVPKFNSKANLFRYKYNRYRSRAKVYLIPQSILLFMLTCLIIKEFYFFDLIIWLSFSLSLGSAYAFMEDFIHIWFLDD